MRPTFALPWRVEVDASVPSRKKEHDASITLTKFSSHVGTKRTQHPNTASAAADRGDRGAAGRGVFYRGDGDSTGAAQARPACQAASQGPRQGKRSPLLPERDLRL